MAEEKLIFWALLVSLLQARELLCLHASSPGNGSVKAVLQEELLPGSVCALRAGPPALRAGEPEQSRDGSGRPAAAAPALTKAGVLLAGSTALASVGGSPARK